MTVVVVIKSSSSSNNNSSILISVFDLKSDMQEIDMFFV